MSTPWRHSCPTCIIYNGTGPDAGKILAMLARFFEADGCLGQILLCLKNESAIGFASFTLAVPGPDFRPVLYIKDLFVRDGDRGAGAGEYMMAELARYCRDRDCARIDLSTEAWNEAAMRFYHRLGGIPMERKRSYRFAGPGLEALARLS